MNCFVEWCVALADKDGYCKIHREFVWYRPKGLMPSISARRKFYESKTLPTDARRKRSDHDNKRVQRTSK